eukprot:GHRR01037705.1.p1 GENE.GHRR01037705.1~~GHRR01037705.1.p1  ORF type:complete len:101 (-),score=11.66 GHRR01037705.1:465-767(-)
MATFSCRSGTHEAPGLLPPPAWQLTDLHSRYRALVIVPLVLAGFFSQFGKLARVRLSRTKKTAKPKHYAFLEFQHSDVAKIAADTMDGYFIFKQVSSSCR